MGRSPGAGRWAGAGRREGWFVSPQAALDDYGVVIDGDALTVDTAATAAKREAIRNARGNTGLFHRFGYFDSESEELEWVNRNIPR